MSLVSKDRLSLVGRIFAISLLIAGAACGGEEPPDDVDLDVSFAHDVAPIFDAKCNACHWTGNAVNVDLTAPFDAETGLILHPNSHTESDYEYLVDPGNVENSSLIVKISDPNLPTSEDGNPMPWDVPRVTEEELDDIKQWIADGATDDAFFAENVAPVFGTEVTLRRFSGKCTWCHAPGAPHSLDVTNVFDPEVGMVDVDSVFGGKIVAPGDVENSMLIEKLESDNPPGAPMPRHYEPLTEAEVDVITRWVAAGAPDN